MEYLFIFPILADVVVVARRRAELEALARELRTGGGRVLVVVGDICEEGFADEVVAQSIAEFGKLDVAFNNAGTLGALVALTELKLEQWNRVINTNLTAAFLCARSQLRVMKAGASLIFTSTFVGHSCGMPAMSAYAASKAGLIGLAKCLAAEYGPHGIRVNALLPGGTDTEMAREFADTPETRSFVEQLHALKRIASPEEIARAALFLASDASSFVTGTAMLVDGGVSINRS